MNFKANKFSSLGFTLIELLIVIAILGALAAVILVTIDPVQQFARSRDSQRKVRISQLGKALEVYNLDSNTLPAESTTWMNDLSARGYIKNVFSAISGNRACTAAMSHNGFCYDNVTPNGYIFTYIESKGEASKCSGGVGGASSTVYFVYEFSTGRSCIKCGNVYTGACNAVQ